MHSDGNDLCRRAAPGQPMGTRASIHATDIAHLRVRCERHRDDGNDKLRALAREFLLDWLIMWARRGVGGEAPHAKQGKAAAWMPLTAWRRSACPGSPRPRECVPAARSRTTGARCSWPARWRRTARPARTRPWPRWPGRAASSHRSAGAA